MASEKKLFASQNTITKKDFNWGKKGLKNYWQLRLTPVQLMNQSSTQHLEILKQLPT